MSERLQIDGGYNGPDLVWQALYQGSAPDQEANPMLTERCAEVYGHALTLMSRLEGHEITKVGKYTVTLTTAPIEYTAHLSDRDYPGFVWLRQKFYRPTDSPLTFNPTISRVQLLAGLQTDKMLAHSLFSLSPTDILYRQDMYLKPGNHAELNLFRAVIDRIKDQAFPRDKQLETEQKADREADTARRHKAAEAVRQAQERHLLRDLL